MLMPSIFRENLLDDFFGYPFRGQSYDSGMNEMMKTDVRDMGDTYEMSMSLPGVKKEDIRAEIKDGYLIVSASSNTEKDEKDGQGKYIRRERYLGSCSRSFYVGREVTQEDIKAKFTDGILTLVIPRKEAAPAVEENKYIAIEG